MRSRSLRSILLSFLGVAVLAVSLPCQAAGTLTTAPVDYSLYREGEVKRTERWFSGWLLTCDEIRRAARKFCSLRSVARSTDGTIVSAIAVSTDELGRPAAIVTLPFGTLLSQGLSIAFLSATRRGRADLVTLHPSQCEGLGCQIVWPFTGHDIGELRAGHALRFSFQMRPATATATFPTPAIPPVPALISGIVEANGFSDALQASM